MRYLLICGIALISCTHVPIKTTLPDPRPVYNPLQQDSTPTPSTRKGKIEIVTVFELREEKDTIYAINWQMHASGKWYCLLDNGTTRWSDKAPVVLEVIK